MFEVLPVEEWDKLKAVFVEEFGTEETPDPATTEIHAAFGEDGEIICFYLLERVIHAGPFWVSPEHRRRGLARRMAEEALQRTQGVEGYIAATKPEVEHLAESMGLVRIVGSLWCKEKDDVR